MPNNVLLLTDADEPGDLADFVYFLAVGRDGSFRRAASKMGVTTSALNHAIASLEARRSVDLRQNNNIRAGHFHQSASSHMPCDYAN